MIKKEYFKRSLALHKRIKGKISISSKFPLENKDDLSLAYTPGVAEVSRYIAKHKKAAFDYTLKSNSVAVISDGSAVLGLGDIGPEGALPVMEGKAILFKKFAGIDAYPICLATKDVEEIIRTIKIISVGFGGINLEDISAPRCFAIEDRLKKELSIPVMHDDQHGTAIVVLAGLINAFRVVRKDMRTARFVVNGAGAAATAIVNLMMRFGVSGAHISVLDSRGIIYKGRPDLDMHKKALSLKTNGGRIRGGLEEALRGADVFIGVSKGDVLVPEWVDTMADDPVVFAMANPYPEISIERARNTKIKIFGTGRSDYPNQINNVLAFPGIFRGALDARARGITDTMKLAAARALADLISKKALSEHCIIPDAFDPRVVPAVARAVKKAI